MKMRLSPRNHHHEHQGLPLWGNDKVRDPTISGCHINSCMVSLARLNKAGTAPHSLHGKALEQRVPLIMYEQHAGALQGQAVVPWDTRTHAQDNGLIAIHYASPSDNTAACACSEHSAAASKER